MLGIVPAAQRLELVGGAGGRHGEGEEWCGGGGRDCSPKRKLKRKHRKKHKKQTAAMPCQGPPQRQRFSSTPRSTTAHPSHAGRCTSPRTPRANLSKKQPATISSLLPHMPGLELKLCRALPAETASPRDTAAASARLEQHKRVEQMYQLALQKRREAALRGSSDEHVPERFLAQEPPSVLALPSAVPARPPDAVFRNPAHHHSHPSGGGDSAAAPVFLTQTAGELLQNGQLAPTTAPATARAHHVERCQSARSPRSARPVQRATSAPPRPLRAVPLFPEGDARRQAEALAAAAIRSALDRALARRPREGVEGEVSASPIQSPRILPLSMGSIESRYPSRSPRPATAPQLQRRGRTRHKHGSILCYGMGTGAARGREDRPTDA